LHRSFFYRMVNKNGIPPSQITIPPPQHVNFKGCCVADNSAGEAQESD
jgi:hypothetical protein